MHSNEASFFKLQQSIQMCSRSRLTVVLVLGSACRGCRATSGSLAPLQQLFVAQTRNKMGINLVDFHNCQQKGLLTPFFVFFFLLFKTDYDSFMLILNAKIQNEPNPCIFLLCSEKNNKVDQCFSACEFYQDHCKTFKRQLKQTFKYIIVIAFFPPLKLCWFISVNGELKKK